MNDEFNRENEDEVVDNIPKGAKHIGEEEQQDFNNGFNGRSFNGYNRGTKIIIENGSASMMSKIAFICALGSVIFCLFPTFSIILALLGGGLALINIANGNNGRIVSVFAIIISIAGAILAGLSSIIIMIFHAIFGILF